MLRSALPYVNIKITREDAKAEQKAALIKGVTDLLVNILDKNPATTFVVSDEYGQLSLFTLCLDRPMRLPAR